MEKGFYIFPESAARSHTGRTMVLLPMLPPIHCPVSTVGLAISAVQCLNILAFANEKQTPTGYSKFADKATAKIPSQIGMLVIYVPAMVTAGAMLATAPQVNGREALVAGMTLVHFAKRVVEVLCVHKYSGSMGPMCYGIGTFYALITLLITVQTQNVPPSLYAWGSSQAALPVALGLFALGELGNLYHHVLLASLRRGKDTQAKAQVLLPTTHYAPLTTYHLPLTTDHLLLVTALRIRLTTHYSLLTRRRPTRSRRAASSRSSPRRTTSSRLSPG